MGGVKQYIEAMCLQIIDRMKDGDHLTIFHNCPKLYFNSTKPHVEEVLLGSGNKLFCDFVLGPWKMNRRDLDVVWFTKYVVPFGVNCKTITTVHDLAYYMPWLNAYTLKETLYMRTMIQNSIRRVDEVVAISQNTKTDILNLLDVPEEKVHVIPLAADEKYRIVTDQDQLQKFRKRQGLPEKYILFTGDISPRKNLARLIRAFERISSLFEHKLVITGTKGWNNREVTDAIERNPRIIWLGFVEDQEMPFLYNAASLFVYPSLYEGFGLPILEAQRCGCPVVSAKNSSLIEVGGDGVLFCNADDETDIGEKITLSLCDSAIMNSLREKGAINQAKFSWAKSADVILDLMRNVVNR